MNHKQVSIILGSLIGTAVLHTILVACSGGAVRTPDARAQDATPTPAQDAAPTSCTSWQIAAYYTPKFITGASPPPTGGPVVFSEGLASAVQIPAGWEPISASLASSISDSSITTFGAIAVVRKCVQ